MGKVDILLHYIKNTSEIHGFQCVKSMYALYILDFNNVLYYHQFLYTDDTLIFTYLLKDMS